MKFRKDGFVTDRKHAAKDIGHAKILLGFLLDNIPDMVFVKDYQDLRFVQFNKAAEELLGHTRSEMIGKNDYDFFPKDEADFFTSKDREVFKTHRLVNIPEEPIQTKHKGVRYLHTKKIPIVDEQGKPLYLLGISEDITERKRAEKDRERIFTHSLDMLCIADFDGYFKELNPAWDRTLGYTKQELLSKPYIEFVHPDDRASTLAEAQKISTGRETIVFENRYRCKDGSYKWLLWNATPVVEDQLIFAAARDITDHKRLEDEREKLIAQLQSALARVKSLEGILPICAHCKRIRDDQGRWHAVETYVSEHSNADFSHSICPICLDKHYPGVDFPGRPPREQAH
jgi:PAS domain S-box-containing protein